MSPTQPLFLVKHNKMRSKKYIYPLLFLLFAVTSIPAQSVFSLSSPDHTISVDISLKEKIFWHESFAITHM